ncbi:MAG: hemerythrin domain-containing protein [Gemmatimonadetes bacterium]|nr:hemerythrin domain-containing protein [Gemmatimonadota bacterium]
MRATDILMEEHRVIERVLDALETAVRHLDGQPPVRPGFFLDASEFISGFADGCHHRKEEGVLFGALVDSGLPKDDGAIAMMLDEHEQGRAFNRAIRDGARRLEAGDAAAARPLATAARGYVALLRDHIAKEDEMLFPLADEMIAPERLEDVLRGFAEIERQDAGVGAVERFHALAARLEEEAAALGR